MRNSPRASLVRFCTCEKGSPFVGHSGGALKDLIPATPLVGNVRHDAEMSNFIIITRACV